MKTEKNITGADYLYLALYAFVGIGLELILVGVIEPLFGISLENYTTIQNIIHWIVICIIWLAVFGGFLYGSADLVVAKDYRKALPLTYISSILNSNQDYTCIKNIIDNYISQCYTFYIAVRCIVLKGEVSGWTHISGKYMYP